MYVGGGGSGGRRSIYRIDDFSSNLIVCLEISLNS